MPRKIDPDSTPGVKLLRMFQKLMLDGRRHFQTDLAEWLQCSPQTIIRLAAEIESVIGINLESGLSQRRRWYQIRTVSSNRLGLNFEEVRYLSICRDMATAILPKQVKSRVDDTIFSLSLLLSDQDYARREDCQGRQVSFFSKGRIDYSPHFETIEKLQEATQHKKICMVLYRASGRAEAQEYRFAPGQIVSQNNAFYVLGAKVTDDYAGIQRLTNLAIHRIAQVTLTDRKFTFDLPEAQSGTFGLPHHEPRTFRVKFKAGPVTDYVRERTWSSHQTITDLPNGALILELQSCSEPELMSWVRSFGDKASCIAT